MAWRSSSSSEANEEMVKTFKSTSAVTTKVVEDAFLNVPRAAFLPEDLHDEAYSDRPIRGDDHIHMSAPHMYATVLEALELKPGMSFLNIGSGTGYFSMLVGYIIGLHGTNHGIEVKADLVEHSNDYCDNFFVYMSKMKKRICYPQFMVGNCFHIDPSAQDYDRVYCGAACPQNKLEFLLKLVKPGGFVIVPTGSQLIKIVHNSPTGAKVTILSDVCFESLVLPDDAQPCPKLRFAGLKHKKKKLKVYPPPGLLVGKNSARKLLARLRALQDFIDCIKESRCLPKAFAYVPCFRQISQLTAKKSKSSSTFSASDESLTTATTAAHHPVEQTINFFGTRLKDGGSIPDGSSLPDENYDQLWNNIQSDSIWESVLEYTYSLSNVEQARHNCVNVYTKQRRSKRTKKHQTSSLNKSSPNGRNGFPKSNLVESQSGSPRNNFESQSKKVTTAVNHETSAVKQISSSECTISGVQNARQHLSKAEESSIVLSVDEHNTIQGICLMEAAKESCSGTSTDNLSSHLCEHDCFHEATEKASFTSTKDLDKTDLLCSQHSSQGAMEKENYTSRKEYDNNNLRSDLCEHSFEATENDSLTTGTDLNKIPSDLLCDHDSSHEAVVEKDCPKSGDFVVIPPVFKKSLGKHDNSTAQSELCVIETDEGQTNTLRMPPGPNWTADEDNQLVQLLMNSFGCSTSKTNRKCLSKHISIVPNLFSPSVLVRYPKLSGYSATALTYRALALFRVVQIIDYVIPYLCSTSSASQSLTEHLSEKFYVLKSFTDTSFAFSKHPASLDQSSSQDQDEASGLASDYLMLSEEFKRISTLYKSSMKCQHDDKCKRQLAQLIEKKNQIDMKMKKMLCASGQSQLSLDVDKLSKHQIEIALRGLTTTTTTTSNCVDCDDRNMALSSNSSDLHKYCINSILTNLTFLLPLSSRRVSILTELLRATEQPFSDRIPVLYLDRRITLAERLARPEKSVFYQIFDEFRNENMNFRCNKRKCEQWWEVKFVGEGIIDQGGGFRDSLAELSDELCPQDPKIKTTLPLFVPSVNQRDQVGEFRDCFVPNPSCKDMAIFRWLGMLMGAAYRSDESLTLSLPPFIWKLLVGEHVTWSADFASVDEASVRMIYAIECVKKEEFVQLYGGDLDYTTALSDGSVVDVKQNGGQILVNYDDCLDYCKMVKKTRMMECVEQVKSIKEGLITVIPEVLLDLITYQELERGVCGFNEISISLLKESIQYSDDLSADSDCVLQLWKVLEDFSMEDRSRFLRFVSGRKRLPATITLSQMCGEKDTLPSASTCASTLMLPSYSSVEIAQKKLRYAIYNCVAIDTDTNPW